MEPEPSAESGFKIERKTYAPDGREIAFDKLKQNDRVVVVLKVTEVDPKLGQIVVEDRLPAGFDIENPALLKGSDLKSFLLAAIDLYAGVLGLPRRPLRGSLLA